MPLRLAGSLCLARTLRLESVGGERRSVGMSGGADREIIVVLGAALGPEGELGPLVAERVLAGVEAWRAGRAGRLMMTGAREAEAMRRRALKLGVPESRIMVEPRARTTRENALRCADLMRAAGLTRALLVTQGFHQRRAVAAFRRVGVEAFALQFPHLNRLKWALREWVAWGFYWLRGWL